MPRPAAFTIDVTLTKRDVQVLRRLVVEEWQRRARRPSAGLAAVARKVWHARQCVTELERARKGADGGDSGAVRREDERGAAQAASSGAAAGEGAAAE